MGENVVFLVIFDTCDVVYNWFISLLPSIVLDNLNYQISQLKVCSELLNMNIKEHLIK